MNGALLVDKPPEISSFGVIECLQRTLVERDRIKRKNLPKMGHGGTLDPFATGLLVVCIGDAAKLARYFLGSTKGYEGIIRFGETTIPGDPTAPISGSSERVPASLQDIQECAHRLTLQDYLQTPPMHSAKKHQGKPLYEFARAGIEVEREARLCRLFSFEILKYDSPRAAFQLRCSSGTYVRTLAQDLGRLLGGVAMLDSLRRTSCGEFRIEKAWTLDEVMNALRKGQNFDSLPCWIPFDRLLDDFARVEATPDEAKALLEGRQQVLLQLLPRVRPSEVSSEAMSHPDHLAIFLSGALIAVAHRDQGKWGIERVFVRNLP